MRSLATKPFSKTSFTLLKEELRNQIPRLTLLFTLALIGTAVGLFQPFLFKLLLDTAIPAAGLRLIGLLLVGMVIVPDLSAGLNAANYYPRACIGESIPQRLALRPRRPARRRTRRHGRCVE